MDGDFEDDNDDGFEDEFGDDDDGFGDDGDIDDLLDEIDEDERAQQEGEDEQTFTWYRQSHGDHVKFYKNNKIQLCGKNRKRKAKSEIACIGYRIDLNLIKQLSFEIELESLNRSLTIGFVMPDELGAPGLSDYHAKLYENDGFGITIIKNKKYIQIDKAEEKFPDIIIPNEMIQIPNKSKSGDRIRVVVDGVNKSIRLFINDILIGTPFENIPNFLMPAVASYKKKEKCSAILKQRKFHPTFEEEEEHEEEEVMFIFMCIYICIYIYYISVVYKQQHIQT